MVIFIFTKNGYEEMAAFIKKSKPIVWLNDGVLNQDELKNLRKINSDVTNFTHVIDKNNKKQINEEVETIKLHHPKDIIWIEA